MNETIYKLMFSNLGLYSESGGKSLLAVFSNSYFEDTMSFSEAVKNDSVSFIYTDIDEGIKTEDAKILWERCRSILFERKHERGIIWILKDESIVFPMSKNFAELAAPFNQPISGSDNYSINIQLKNGAGFLTDEENGALILESKHKSYFSFGTIGLQKQIGSLSIVLCRKNAGKIIVGMDYDSPSDNFCNCGFEYGFADERGEMHLISNRIFETAKIRNELGWVGFEFGFGALHGNTMRFWDANKSILCNFSDLYGNTLYISPVASKNDTDGGGFAFLPLISENINCTPLGKYYIRSRSGSDIKLLCGFSGTEYISLQNNSVIEFVPGCSAFSNFYPEKEFSINDFVEPQPKKLLNDDLITSWIKFYGNYHSQPLESPFFSGSGEVMPLADLYTDFSKGSPTVPIMPYKNVKFSNENAGDILGHSHKWAQKKHILGFEKSILTSERVRQVNTYMLEKNNKRIFLSSSNCLTASTPSGFIGEVDGSSFKKITIAFTPNGNLAFDNATDEVLAIFLASTTFCVIANKSNIGKFTDEFGADDWNFKLSAGDDSRYNEYANIIIIKSMTGKIYDPDNLSGSLCSNVNLWTCKEFFSKPYEGEVANLAGWILRYCKNAFNSYIDGDKYYENFVKIITNENWKGFLSLNVSLSAAAFPDCLKPLLAGLSDVSSIRAHHIGSEIVSVKATEFGPTNDGFSPFFGLIRYKADGFYGSPIPIEDTSAEHEFKLLEMNTLFEKGAVKDFNSLSQLVAGKFISLKPSAGGCLYNALLLNGSLQTTDGHSVLMMNSNGGTFMFEGAPVQKAVISGITVISVNPDNMEFAFDISGSMSFVKPGNDSPDVLSYDIFSFSGYKLNLVKGLFSLDLSKMSFNLSNSEARELSFGKTFGIVPLAAVAGKSIVEGYKPIAAYNFKNGTLAEGSFGIEFSINLGSLGSLSEGAVLNAKIILAWDCEGNKFFGIKMPGASLINNVFGITFGDAQLKFENNNLFLHISKVVLQLLGMMKLPSSGAINLALIGCGEGIGWFAAYNKKV